MRGRMDPLVASPWRCRPRFHRPGARCVVETVPIPCGPCPVTDDGRFGVLPTAPQSDDTMNLQSIHKATGSGPGQGRSRRDGKIFCVGGGIAALAAAAFMIRDGERRGRDITVIEPSDAAARQFDSIGSARDIPVPSDAGTVGRKDPRTADLFASILTRDGMRSVRHDGFAGFGAATGWPLACLVSGGRRVTTPDFDLDPSQMDAIERLVRTPDAILGRSRVGDHFDDAFFATNFWSVWSASFAFQRWHGAAVFKRYIAEADHAPLGGGPFDDATRAVLDQEASLVPPLRRWLLGCDVVFAPVTAVTNLLFREVSGGERVRTIVCRRGRHLDAIAVGVDDLVLVTLGSTTEGASLGGMDHIPILGPQDDGGAWALWKTLAADRPHFGRPSAFSGHVDESRWISFAITLRDDGLLRILHDLIGSRAERGGLVTFRDSAWRMTVVVPDLAQRREEPDEVAAIWGYGLAVGATGDIIAKPMTDCTGREIMTEVLGQLRIDPGEAAEILTTSACVPSLLPFSTSPFLPHEKGDRPEVVSKGIANLAFMGQFCDVAGTRILDLDYAISTAHAASDALLGLVDVPFSSGGNGSRSAFPLRNA